MLVGERIGSYILEACLGEGATSSVFRARHADLGSVHAVKVLDRREASLRQRFLDEARFLAQVKHPYVVSVHDLITDESRLAMVLQYVDGPSLDRWRVLHAPFRSDRVRLLADLLTALSSLHRAGLVHRDVKPQNILVADTPEGWRPVVIDLGIARSDGGQTRAGSRMGTPWYMAPEQMLDATNVDGRTDLFALGVVAYELFADRRPFADDADWERSLEARRQRAYVPLVQLGLPVVLSEWVDGLLAPDPADRPATAEVALGMLPQPTQATWPTLIPSTLHEIPARTVAPARFGGMAVAILGAVALGFVGANVLPSIAAEPIPVAIQCLDAAHIEDATPSAGNPKREARDIPAEGPAKKGIRLPFFKKNR